MVRTTAGFPPAVRPLQLASSPTCIGENQEILPFDCAKTGLLSNLALRPCPGMIQLNCEGEGNGGYVRMVAGPRNQPPLRALPRKGRSYFPRADYRFVTWLQAGSGKIQWFIEVAGLPLRKSGRA